MKELQWECPACGKLHNRRNHKNMRIKYCSEQCRINSIKYDSIYRSRIYKQQHYFQLRAKRLFENQIKKAVAFAEFYIKI